MNNYKADDLVKVKLQLKNLANRHYICLGQYNVEETSCYFFDGLVVKKALSETLYPFVQIVGLENVDLKVLESGIEEMVTREADFKPNKYNIHVSNENISLVSGKEVAKLPLVYQVLQVIFLNCDQLLRQYYFHELLCYYYNTLENLLLKGGLDICSLLPKDIFEDLLKKYIPYVKLEVMFHYIGKYQNMRNKSIARTATLAIMEINECIKCPKILREDCYQILKSKLSTSEYKFLKYELVPLDGRPGFLGDYFKLKISVHYKNKEELFHFFAKYLPSTNEVWRSLAIASFKKEEFFYKTYIPWLVQLGLEEVSKFAPKCHFVRSNKVIILEDISVLGYQTPPWGCSMNYERLSLSLKQLAKLHASSLLYEEKMSDLSGQVVRIGEENEEFFREINFAEKESTGSLNRCGARHIYDYFLKKFPEIPRKMTLTNFRDEVVEAFRLMFGNLKKSAKYRNVVCHGDAWGSNILYQENTNSNTPCYLIDYQLIRYCPPAVDILFFLYTNSNKETRLKYQTELINDYYNELADLLNRYDIDINNIYPFETFMASCENFKLSAICQSSCYKQVLLCPKETIESVNSDEEKASHFYNVDRSEIYNRLMENTNFKDGMREVVEDLYEECEKKCNFK